MVHFSPWLQALRGPGRAHRRRPPLHIVALEERLAPDSGGGANVLAGQNLAYLGGPVIPNVAVHALYLTDAGTSMTSALQAPMDAYFQNVTTGTYIPTLLSQYGIPGSPIGNGRLGKDDVAVSVTPDTNVGASPAISDQLIQTTIDAEIKAGNTAAANPNNLYVVFTPPGDAVVAPFGNSVRNFGGYHTSFIDSSLNDDYYAVIPDASPPNAQGGLVTGSGLSQLQATTLLVAHEFAESITDPTAPRAWANPVTFGAGEVGDQANGEAYTQDGFLQQYEWSNASGGPAHAPGVAQPNLFINQLAPPAVTSWAGGPIATFTDPDQTLNVTSFQAIVQSIDSNNVVSANWAASITGGANGVYVLSATPPTPLTAGQVGKIFTGQGLNVFLYDKVHNFLAGGPFSYRYQPYVVSASAPLTYNADNGGVTHNFNLTKLAGNFVLTDNGQTVFTQPIAATTAINIGAEPGASSSLTIDYSASQFELPITFDGGTGPGNHSLVINGGNFTSINDQMTSATDGTIALTDPTGSFNITYSHVSGPGSAFTPVTLGSLTFALPAGGTSATLQDDGTAGNNLTTLTSTNNSFPAFTFLDPTTALTVNFTPGYSLTLTSLDSQYNAPLTLSDGGAGGSTVNVNMPLTLGAPGKPGNITIAGGIVRISKPISATNGGAISLGDTTSLNTAQGATITAAGKVQVAGPGAVSLSATVSSATGLVSFAGPVTMFVPLTLTGTSVNFGSTLDDFSGNDALTIAGNASFAGSVGAGKGLNALSVSGTVALGGNVTTTNAQLYSGDATLTGNAILTSASGGNITFGGKLDGGFALTVNSAGQTSFNAAIGSLLPLASLTTDPAGTTTLAGNVTTGGAQAFHNPLSFGQAVTNLTGTAVTLTSTINLGTGTLNIAGNLTLDPAATLIVQLAGNNPSQFGHISHTGSADLAGATLTVTRAAGFVPNLGNSFAIVGVATNGSLTNTFNGEPEGSILNLGGVTFTLSYAGGRSGSDFVMTTLNAPPAQVAFTKQPTDVVAGQKISPVVKVTVEDAVGDQITSNALITLQVNTGPKGGTLGGTFSVPALNGVATFSNLILDTAGTYTLQATAAGLTSGISTSFVVSPDVPFKMAFEAPPQNVIAGQVLPPVNVDVLDSFGNVVSTSGISVSLVANGPSSFTPAVVQQNTTSGVAGFTTLALPTVGTYTLTAGASVGGTPLPSVTSAAFTVSAANANHFAAPTIADVTAGQALPAFSVELLDAFGNVTTSNAQVNLQLSGPGTFAPGAVTSAVASNGVATFNGLTLTRSGTYTLTFSGAGLAAVPSNPFKVVPDVPTQLTFAGPVAGATAGQKIPDFVVNALDQFGNLTSTKGIEVDLTLSDPHVPFSASATTVNGQATFSGLSLQKAGSYTLSAAATAAGLPAIVSSAFTISPTSAYQLALLTTPPTTTAGVPLPALQVVVEDQFQNMVPTASGPIHLDAKGPVLVGADSTVAQGGAQFNLTLTTAGTYTLTISAPGLQAVSSLPFTVNPAAAFQVAFTSGPASIRADQPLPTIQAQVEDQFGNPVASGLAVSVSATGPGTFPTGTTTSTLASAGAASFPGLALNTAGSYTLTLSAGNLQSSTSPSFTISPAPASQLTFEASPGTLTAGDPLPVLKVDLRDRFGNLVAASDPVTLTAVGPGPLSGSVSAVATGGIALFTGLALNTSGSYMLKATTTFAAGSITPGVSNSFTVNPAAATKLLFEATPASVSAGQTLGPVNVDVRDQFGNPVSGVPVTITVAGPGGFSAGTTTQKSVNGVATFSDLVLQSAGGYTLTAAGTGLSNTTTGSFTITPAGASKLAIVSAVPDTTAGVALPDVKAAIEDQFGNLVPAAGATISLAANGPAGLSAGPSSASTTGGVATFHGVKLNTAGSYTLTASALGLTAGSSPTFHITPAAASLLVLAPPAAGTAGTPLGEVDVHVLDPFGNPVPGVPVTLAPGGLSATSAANGIAAFTGLTLTTAGSYALTAQAGTLSQTSSTFPVNAAPASQLAFSVNPVDAVAGTTLPDIQVQVEDAFGNPVASAAAIGLNATGPGSFTGSATATGGVATFHGLSFPTAGSYTLSASAIGLTSGSSTSFTISAAAPAQVNFESIPSTATAGAPLPDLKADIEDAFGNRVPGAAGSISLAVTGPASPSAGPSSASATNGTAIFSGVTLNTVGPYTLQVSATGLHASPAQTVTIQPAAAAQLAFLSSVAAVTAGQPVGNVVVAVQDAFGNLVTTPNFTVTLAFTGPANPAGSSATVQTSAGKATFASLTLQSAGTYALSASAPGLSTATTPSFTVSPAAASQLHFDASPASAVAGQALSAVRVTVADAFGNPVSGTAVSLTLTGPGSLSAGPTQATSQGGVASFTGLTLQTAGTYTLTAHATGLAAVTSAAFPVNGAAATHLAFVANPGNLTAGQALPDVQIQLLDPFGNPATSSTAVISLSSSPGTLGASATTAQGSATFSGLSLSSAGTYTLAASAPGLTGASTTPFAVTPAAASQLAFEANPTDTPAGQALTSFKIDVRDAFGNLVVGSTAPVTLSTTGPAGFSGGTTTVNAAGGIATFSGLVLAKAGAYTLSAAGPNLTAATTPSFNIVPGAASQVAFEPLPTSGSAGQPLSALNVDVLDAFGNRTSSNATLTLGVNGPAAPAAGSLSAQAQNGVASFTGLVLNTAGSYTFTAGGPGLNSATSAALPIAPGSPTQLLFEPLPTGGTAGASLPPIKVDVLDSFGNLTTGSTPVTLQISGASGGTSATVPATGGVATFSSLVLPTSGAYTLLASAPSVTSASSANLTAAGTSPTTTPAAATPITIPTTPATTAGKAAQLRFVASALSASAGHAVPAFKIQVFDAKHRPVQAGTLVTVRLKTGQLLGKRTQKTDRSGSVLFTGLKVLKPGTYTLLATTPGLNRITSIQLTVK